jgi:hypothetical protein
VVGANPSGYSMRSPVILELTGLLALGNIFILRKTIIGGLIYI